MKKRVVSLLMICALSVGMLAGCGTQAYTFIWGMVGENQDFDDMDDVAMTDLM